MSETAALRELTGAGLTARTAEGERVAVSIMHGAGEGAVTVTIGERSVEVPLALAALKHLADVAREKHGNALFQQVADVEPRVPRHKPIGVS